MKILAIISEYNPFHEGHAGQIRLLRERFGHDALIVACMSGNWTQRGLPAITDARSRAELALRNGVNLVLELPLPWSVASADDFARGAVRSLAATGLPLTLCFGSETGELAPLEALARLRDAEPSLYIECLHQGLDQGMRFAAAEAEAARAYLRMVAGYASSADHDPKPTADDARPVTEPLQPLGDQQDYSALLPYIDAPEFWRASNNQLAVAYLRAVRNLPRKQRPRVFTHKRDGQAYLDTSTNFGKTQPLSASAIRQAIGASPAGSKSALLHQLQDLLPPTVLGTLLEWEQNAQIMRPGGAGHALALCLRNATREQLESYVGWGEGLAARVLEIVAERPVEPRAAESLVLDYWSYLAEAARSKRHSLARVQRAFCSALLAMKTEQIQPLLQLESIPYLYLLAADKNGRYLLRRMRKSASCPVLTRYSDLLEFSATEQDARALAALKRRGDDVYALLQGESCGRDFDKPPVLG